MAEVHGLQPRCHADPKQGERGASNALLFQMLGIVLSNKTLLLLLFPLKLVFELIVEGN